MIADELRRQADVFIELADIQDEIQRVGGPRKPDYDDGMPQDDYEDDGIDYEDEAQSRINGTETQCLLNPIMIVIYAPASTRFAHQTPSPILNGIMAQFKPLVAWILSF